ncbi:MAG TPA: O-antigen ligase family protein [Acetobacteraceae bacterium]
MFLVRFPAAKDTAWLQAGAMLVLTAATLSALLAPSLFWLLLLALVALGVGFLAYRHLTVFSVVWLLVCGATPEMALSDLLGPAAFQPTIALVKAAEILLALLCMLRHGPRLDMFNPAWAFVMIAVTGLLHGLHPGLTPADSLRSLIGSVAPFVFCFCRTPPAWAPAIIRASKWCPLLVVAAAVPLDIAGLRPLFVESGGERLGGLGHPAFLAGVCLAAIYACLIDLYRDGKRAELALLAANMTILVLTGARAPLACAAGVLVLSMAVVRSTAFPPRYRLCLGLGICALLPVVVLLAGDLPSVRLFNLLSSDAANLSGRQYLWPFFEHAAAASPWVGWGIGAGNTIILPGNAVAQLLHTRAAHNEYLRIEVEGGHLGRAVMLLMFILWVRHHTARLPHTERRVLRLVFLALACHAVTDNVLISTPSCVLFALVAALFARAEARTSTASRGSALPDSPRMA